MAGGSDKKRLAGNAAEVTQKAIMVGVAVPLHALVRMWYFEATMTYMLWVLSLIGIGMCIFSMWVLWSASRAAGADLNLKDGILEYFKDLIIVGAATLVLTCLTDWFFLLYIFPVGYAGYKLVGYAVSYFFPPPDAPPTKEEIKKQAKKERQAEMMSRRSKGK